MAILFRPFGLTAPKFLKIIWLSNLLTMSIPFENYPRKASHYKYKIDRRYQFEKTIQSMPMALLIFLSKHIYSPSN